MSKRRSIAFSKPIRVLLGLGTVFLLQLPVSLQAQAMPMFARKYKVDCTMCHAAVPRLNFTGFKFKAAGYRMPWEIGKPQAEPTEIFENYNSFVGVVTANANITSNTTPPGVVQFNAQELDVHPMTGSWGKSWSTGFEADFMPDGTVGLNQAFVGFTSGSNDSFWSVQGGLVPNYLGFGSLDRALAITTPLVLSSSAGNPSLDTLFDWADPRAAGLTGAYWWNDTYLSASLRDRLNVTAGGLDALGPPSSNHMGDFLISLNQFFDHSGGGSALGLAFYKGQSHLDTFNNSGSDYANNYSRLIGAANDYLTDNFNIYAGGGWGQDQLYDSITSRVDQKLYSNGIYGGLEYFWSGNTALGGRYDYYVSDLNTDGTDTQEATLYFHYHPIPQLIFATEYQLNIADYNTATPGTASVLTAQATFAF